ncbi:peptidoglycan DD-metalloendopeptidase family protein [Leucobacter japonicus]|uniref:peptidoglycan DD-metalloendopeptidase family protein n=1 Tax=Leucobacter japonicus TaxID=1461259 RepID=UPI0006A76FCF|nr:peptidoglycan DD-metalloendopeptidase family protein [Leucobacter japonicus]
MAATGTEIAHGFIALTVKAPGIKRDIAKELGAVDTTGAGQQIGNKLADSMKKTLQIASVGVAGVLGTALVKGFGRLKAIETAQAKMRGLGNDADTVAKAMDNSLAAVKGTAFGLGDAATAAGQLMAANIKPGKELEGVLKTVGNNAAAAGVGFDEMGSIFAKAASQANGIQNDILAQLADKGIPIYQALADQMGVTAGEVFKLASSGKINFETFQAAATAAAGTVADEMGKTTTGSFDNMMAAMGRFGATLLEDVYPLIGPIFQSLTGWLDEAAKKVEPFLSGIKGVVDLLATGNFTATLREAFGWEEDSGPVTFLLGLRDTAITVFAEVSGGVRAMVAAFENGGTDVTSSGFAGFLERVGLAARALADFVAQKLIPGFVTFGQWVVQNKDWLAAIALTVGGVVLGMKAWTVATTAWAAVTKGAAVVQTAYTAATVAYSTATTTAGRAQAIFNAVLGANPIVKIVTLVMALVGALVYFFSSTETGKKIWAGFMGFLQDAWANISQFFQDTWNNVLKPVFEGIGQVLSFVWNSILKPVFDGIAAVVGWVFNNILVPLFKAAQFQFAIMAGIFQGIWDFILKPVFDAIGAVFKWLWDTIISVIIGYIKINIQVLGAVFSWLWTNAIKPAIDAISKAFSWLWANVIQPVANWISEKWRILGLATQLMWTTYIQPAFTAIGDALNWVWVNIISPVVEWIRQKWEILGLATRIMYEQYIKPAWDKVASVISSVWNTVKGVIETMVRVIQSDPKKAFEAARDAIGKAWAGIQDLAKKPVRFVIETVINGLIGTVNKILPEGMKIPEVPLPKGFSDGGYTGNMARDAVAGVVHGDEHVIRASSRRAIESRHPGLLDHMNQHGSIPGYRSGGLVDPLPQGSFSVSQPYKGAAHNGIDLAAAAGTKVYAAADGVVGLAGSVNMGGNEVYVQHANGLGTRYSHLSRFGTSAGQSVKAGNVIGYVGSTGMSTGPHLHYMVQSPGLGAGNYSNHVNPAAFMGSAAKDLGEGGGAASILDGLVDWAIGQIKSTFPGGGMWVDVATGLAKQAAGMMAKAFNPFAASDGHTMLYDNGGWLPPGKSLVENKSGRPEPILTSSQWDDLLDSKSGSGLDGSRLRLVVDGREFDAYVDDRADGAVYRGFGELSDATRRASYVG